LGIVFLVSPQASISCGVGFLGPEGNWLHPVKPTFENPGARYESAEVVVNYTVIGGGWERAMDTGTVNFLRE